MLAVSGAVEAARAGDFGKGFAVVSKDIRNLARNSGENAGRIKDTVRAIQDQIAAVRKDLEQIVVVAEAENQRNALLLCRSRLRCIRTWTSSAAGNQQILTAPRSILSSLKEAARGAQQIATAAEEAGSAAAEASAAAKQQARGAEELAAAIEEIASLAEDIQRPPWLSSTRRVVAAAGRTTHASTAERRRRARRKLPSTCCDLSSRDGIVWISARRCP